MSLARRHSFLSPPVNTELSLAATVQTLPGSEWDWQDRVPIGKWESTIFMDNGKIYLGSCKIWGPKFQSMGMMAVIDKETGIYPASIETSKYQGEVDNHLTAKIYADASKIYAVQEFRHGSNQEVWIADKDNWNFQQGNNLIGDVRRGIFYPRSGGGFRMTVQINSGQDLAFVDFDGTNWSAVQPLVLIEQVGKRLYPYAPFGQYYSNNGWDYIILANGTSGGFEEFYEFKTQDWVTFYNRTQTHSFVPSVTTPTTAVLRANGYKICGVQNSPNNLSDYHSCIDNSGNVYHLFYQNYNNEMYFIRHNGVSYIQTLVTWPEVISGYSTPVITDDAALQWMQYRNGKIYAIVRCLVGGFYKAYLFQSNDGLVWNTIGDVFPHTNETIDRCYGPQNVIPDNVNFAFVGCKGTYVSTANNTTDVYVRTASWGSITPYVADVSTSTYPNKAAMLADIGFSMYYDTTDVDLLSDVITELNDQSGNNNHATTVGSAAHIEGGAIKTYGSTHFSISNFADFRTNTQFTFVTVARKVNDAWLLSFGDTGAQFQYLGLRLVMGRVLNYLYNITSVSSDQISGYGQLVGIDYAIIVVTCNGRHLRIFINDVEVNKEWNDSAPAAAVRWANGYNTQLDNMLIGAAITSNIIGYTPLDFKCWGYKNSVITDNQRRRLFNYLSSTYAITLRSLGTQTSYEPEAELAFLRMGVQPDNAEKLNLSAQITLIKQQNGLNTGELCLANRFDFIYLSAQSNQNNALINFAREKFDLVPVNSPTFTANRGFRSNGTTSYLRNGFRPARHSSFLNNSFEAFAYVIEDAVRGNKAVMGTRQTVPSALATIRIIPRNASDQSSFIVVSGSAVNIATITDMRGFYSAQKSGSTTTEVRKDLTTNITVTSSQAFVDKELYFLGSNVDDTSVEFLLDANVAVWGWGSWQIDNVALRTSLRDWLIAKGVTGI
ncbi:MAG: hypothetical protein ACK5OS_01940 [Chryseotalea sp.]